MTKRDEHGRSLPDLASAAHNDRPLWAWLDVAPVAWLLLVGAAYWLLATAEMVPTKRPVPGIPEADRLALPFLALTVTAGIVRYYCVWVHERRTRPDSETPNSQRRDIA